MCSVCEYPLRTCVCRELEQVELPVNVIILQDHREAKHAKNTARLAKLIAPSIDILCINTNNITLEVSELLEAIKETSLLVYPSDDSQYLETVISSSEFFQITHLVFIDASWKQAYRLFKSIPLLDEFKAVKFNESTNNLYHYRKSKHSYYLSTIEAVSLALYKGYNTSRRPFIKVLDKLNRQWQSYRK